MNQLYATALLAVAVVQYMIFDDPVAAVFWVLVLIAVNTIPERRSER